MYRKDVFPFKKVFLKLIGRGMMSSESSDVDGDVVFL